MFVPTLWYFDPKTVYEVVGSKFGCGPCGSAERGTVYVSTGADSLWSFGKFECLIGIEGAAEGDEATKDSKCHAFAADGTCSFGKNCRFSHGAAASR